MKKWRLKLFLRESAATIAVHERAPLCVLVLVQLLFAVVAAAKLALEPTTASTSARRPIAANAAAAAAAAIAQPATSPTGRLCMTVEHFRPLSNDTSGFLECATLAEEERKAHAIDGKYLGVWTRRACSKDRAFDGGKQRCVERRKLHRQQSACVAAGGGVAPLGCASVCALAPVAVADVRTGVPCTWQRSRLYNDPANNGGFLQCIATSAR